LFGNVYISEKPLDIKRNMDKPEKSDKPSDKSTESTKPSNEKKVTFPATIRRTKKGHWYITIPSSLKKILAWEKEKVVQVTLEKLV
jgi:heme-binding NEAT domain protein